MRELLLLRHAKSAWDVLGLDDHARDLAPRGRKAAKRMGRFVAERGLLPELVLCSTARRAVRTLEILLDQLSTRPPITWCEALYLASETKLLEILRTRDDAIHRLMLVGHDPGFHRLALLLLPPGDPAASASGLIAKFPTGALCHLALPVDRWAEVGPGRARLLGFYKPRELAHD